MNTINGKVIPACSQLLSAEIQELFLPETMRIRACELLANIQTSESREELERSSTFASGFVLGGDLDHVSDSDLLFLQEIFNTAYETRRDQIASL
jgi:hypothetical protein